MIRASSIIRRDQVDTDRIVDVITLDHGDRHRRRIALKADGGTDFLLDLERPRFFTTATPSSSRQVGSSKSAP